MVEYEKARKGDYMLNGKVSKVQELTIASIMVAMAAVLSFFDKTISTIAFPFLPVAKIGLANIVILIAIYIFDFKTSLLITVLKSVVVGLIFGSLSTFIIGGSASLVSFLGMFLTHKLLKDKTSLVGVSVIGGFLHIITQLFVVMFVYRTGDAVFKSGALLVLISLITSILVGLAGNGLYKYLQIHYHLTPELEIKGTEEGEKNEH